MKKEYIKPVATITTIKYESNLMLGSEQIGEDETTKGPGDDDILHAPSTPNLWDDDWD